MRLRQDAPTQFTGRYPLGPGAIEVTVHGEIGLCDITPEPARRSGFAGVVDLLKTARRGLGERVFLVEFEWEGWGRMASATPISAQ